jgi:hypothetical protein
MTRYRTLALLIVAPEAQAPGRPDPGHAAAGVGLPADVDFMNVEIGQFLDVVTQRGVTLR